MDLKRVQALHHHEITCTHTRLSRPLMTRYIIDVNFKGKKALRHLQSAELQL